MLIRAAAVVLASLTVIAAPIANAQTPGEWRYTIVTDMANVPADMRVNFPTITFAACRSADDFSSGRAFALQTLDSSAARCPSSGFVRVPMIDGNGDTLQFVYACDDGKTLSGSARGQVQASRFAIALESRYLPPVDGVAMIKQSMVAVRAGDCKVKPDADNFQVK